MALVRKVLRNSVAVAIIALAGGVAHAADSDRIVVTTFGGVWQKSIQQNFGTCYKDRTGSNIATLLGDPSSWLNRIRANPTPPPIDVVTLGPADTVRAVRAGILEPLDKAKMPHLADVDPANYENWKGMAVDVHTAAMGVMYNKDVIKSPPADWKTLFDDIAAGKYGDRVSMPSGSYTWGPDFIWFIANTYDGNIDTAFDKLKAMAPNVKRFWAEPTEALNLFGTKQVDILIYWDGRAHDFIGKGNDWAGYYNPQPKSLGTSVAFGKVKGGSDAAWQFMDCALAPEAQLNHAEMLGYGITNNTVTYPDALKKRISPTSEMVHVPYFEYLDQFPEWIARWNREMR